MLLNILACTTGGIPVARGTDVIRTPPRLEKKKTCLNKITTFITNRKQTIGYKSRVAFPKLPKHLPHTQQDEQGGAVTRLELPGLEGLRPDVHLP